MHEDQKYIEALLNEDRVLINEIYQKFGNQCKRFVRKNGGTEDEANDIFQEALISIILRAKSANLQLEVPFGAYLYIIYKRKWIDWLNKYNKVRETIVDLAPMPDESKEIEELRWNILRYCFNKLSVEGKKLFNMRFKGMSSKEIAKILNIKPNHVDQKLYACREALKKCVQMHPDFSQI